MARTSSSCVIVSDSTERALAVAAKSAAASVMTVRFRLRGFPKLLAKVSGLAILSLLFELDCWLLFMRLPIL